MERRQPKFSGELAQRISVGRPLRFKLNSCGSGPRIEGQLSKIGSIFSYYEIPQDDPNAWECLAWKLLEGLVPGFQISGRRGPPRRWERKDELKLVQDVDGLTKGRSITISEACQFLARSREYMRFGSRAAGPSARTLHERYKKARKAKSGSDF